MAEEEGKTRGLSKEQLKEYFKQKYAQEGNLPDFWKHLYDREALDLVTETHAPMVLAKVRMKMVLAAIDPKRTKPLPQVWLEEYNTEMISYKRQGRLEGLGALQALETAEEERTTKL